MLQGFGPGCDCECQREIRKAGWCRMHGPTGACVQAGCRPWHVGGAPLSSFLKVRRHTGGGRVRQKAPEGIRAAQTAGDAHPSASFPAPASPSPG